MPVGHSTLLAACLLGCHQIEKVFFSHSSFPFFPYVFVSHDCLFLFVPFLFFCSRHTGWGSSPGGPTYLGWWAAISCGHARLRGSLLPPAGNCEGAMAANLRLRAGSPPLRTVWVTSLGGWGTWCGGAGRGWVVGVGCGGVGDGASIPTITATHTRLCSPFLLSSLGLISLLFGQECAERLGTAPCYYGTVTAWSSKSGVRNEPERRQRWGELTPPALVLAEQAEVWVGPESLPVGLPCLSFLSEPSSPNILLSEQKIWKSLKTTKNSPPPARAA